MKNRIYFKNLVVSADDLPKINQLVRTLSELGPSDAFISIEFNKIEGGFSGTIKLASECSNFTQKSNDEDLLLLMHNLSRLTMVHIDQWKLERFNTEDKEKLIS